MRKYIIPFLLLFFTNVHAEGHSLDKIVAVVNDGIITERQVLNEEQKMRMQLKQMRIATPPANKLHSQALDKLIDKELQLQLAKNAGIEVSDATLNQAIDDIARRNRIAVPVLKQKLAQEGISFSAYRQDLREQIIMSQIQQRQLVQSVTVTDEEVKQVESKIKPMAKGAARYHVIDIFVAIPDHPTAKDVSAAETKIKNLMARLQKGADFSRLAVLQATEAHLPNGGDFGWQTLDQLPELFAQKVQGMSKDQILGPIRAGNGLHIIKLVDIQGAGIMPHYTKQTHVRHILIKTDKTTNDEIAKIRLLQLKEKLQKGADFAEMAKSNSQDPLSNVKGGDLGWVPEGALDPSFERTMNNLKVGQIGGPVKTHFGWHLVQVLGRRQTEDTKDLISNQARNIAYQQKIQQSLPGWLQQLRSSAYVKKY